MYIGRLKRNVRDTRMIPVWTETANKACKIGYYEYKNQEKAIKYLTIML